ncbi:MAG TPA: GDP-mannose 4,6-dehydratase, partial [Myxococcota bacterium]|nr:GDP-mannose 4,6-dehydratase [Myxococcota bacterium]
MTSALITGVTGQDGSYLAELLLARGYSVYGLVRRSSSADAWRIAGIRDRLTLLDGDLLDQGSLLRAIEESAPDEVYNLGAQSFVGRSWREPVHTAEVTGLGALRVLEAVRALRPQARVYQASTSEMYGDLGDRPATADGPFAPRSPYGTAKLFAHTTAIAYRASYGMFVATGILFNHESPRRGVEFVTRKVCRAAARAAAGDPEPLRLGNLDARRDWGWAPDYVEAMWRMLQHERPLDLVVATGETRSVRDLCAAAYGCVGLDWRDHVRADASLLRPADIGALRGDPGPAREAIGW